MKKLEISKMETVNGGIKCIYHGMAAVGSAAFGLVGLAIYAIVDGGNFVDCWNNNH